MKVKVCGKGQYSKLKPSKPKGEAKDSNQRRAKILDSFPSPSFSLLLPPNYKSNCNNTIIITNPNAAKTPSRCK